MWAAGANAMAISLARGRRITLAKVDAFADGVAVKQVCTSALGYVACMLESIQGKSSGSMF
jgi:threonine dehydratase